MTNEAINNRSEIHRIQQMYLSGQLTKEQAEKELLPTINKIHAKSCEIAKKYNKSKPSKPKFSYLMRQTWS